MNFSVFDKGENLIPGLNLSDFSLEKYYNHYDIEDENPDIEEFEKASEVKRSLSTKAITQTKTKAIPKKGYWRKVRRNKSDRRPLYEDFDIHNFTNVLTKAKKGFWKCPNCGAPKLSIAKNSPKYQCYNCGDTKAIYRALVGDRSSQQDEYDWEWVPYSDTSIQPHHREEFEKSAIPKDWQDENFHSIDDKRAIADFLDWKGYRHTPGWASKMGDGSRENNQFKPDEPIKLGDDKPAKYLTSKAGYGILVPNVPGDTDYWKRFKADKSQILDIGEGGKKAVSSMANTGVAAIALCGVAMWHKKGSDDLLPELHELVRDRETIRISFDADQARKPEVRQQIVSIGRALEKIAVSVTVRVWDERFGKGIDDVIANGYDIEKVSRIVSLAEIEETLPFVNLPTKEELAAYREQIDYEEEVAELTSQKLEAEQNERIFNRLFSAFSKKIRHSFNGFCAKTRKAFEKRKTAKKKKN